MSQPLRWKRALVLLGLLPLAASAPSFAQTPDELLPGFKANQVYSSSGIDNVNAFSGDSGIVSPIGPEYTLSAGVSFQISAAFSNKFWIWDTDCGNSGPPAYDLLHATFAIGGPLGLGWAWPLGYVEATVNVATYYSPDGGRHAFELRDSQWVTRDGSNLRLVEAPVPPMPTSYTIEFPDGTKRIYSTLFAPHRAGDSPDFYWQEANTTPPPRFLLREITRPKYPNGTDVLLLVDEGHSGYPETIELNPGTDQARMITLQWELFPETPPPSLLQWKVLKSAVFPGPSDQTLTVTATYETKNIMRLRAGGGTCTELSGWAEVPVLASLETTAIGISPAKTSFDYVTYYPDPPGAGEYGDGSIRKITLPTGGTIEYEYGPTVQHPGAGQNYVPPEDSDLARLEMMTNESPAIIERRETDPTNAAYQSVTRWQRVHDGGPSIGAYRRVVMVSPGAEREFFFTVAEGSAPPSGLELLSRVYQPGAFSTPTNAVWQPSLHAERSVVSCYRGDYDTGSGETAEACNVHDGVGDVTSPSSEWNSRKSRSVTWYTDLQYATLPGEHSDWMRGRIECGSTEPCTKTQSTDYSAPARQYKTVTTTANAKGLMRVKRETTTNYTRVSDGPWVLGVYDYRRIRDLARDGEATWCVEPCTVQTDYTFTSQGFLDLVTIQDRDPSGTLLGSVSRDFGLDTFGNPTTETDAATSESGGSPPRFDTSRSFVTERTFQNGALLSSKRQKPDFSWYHKTLDVTRDDNGYVTSSYDPNGLQTSYAYDALGRLRSVSPPSSNPAASKTTYCYKPPVLGPTEYTGPYVIVREGEPASECSAVDNGGAGRFEVYLYDGFGRLIREIQRIPLGTPTALSFRKTTYDNAGRRSFLSEWGWCPSNDATACFATGNPTGTTWQSFDLFGRPLSIQKADGTTVTILYEDTYCPNGADSCSAPTSKYVRYTDTTVTTTTSNVAGGSSSTRQRKDLLGRIVEETYPYASAPGDGMLYRYNVLDKVAYASTLADEAAPVRVQDARFFTYDRLGNLRSEWHPEKGTTTYLQYDALGANTWRQEQSGTYFNSTFDRLGRLETLTAGSTISPSSHSTYLTQTWDSGSYAGDYPKAKLTTRVGSNYDKLGTPTGTVTEEFGYSGPAGQLTARRRTLANPDATYEEAWTHDDLGYLTFYGHPLRSGSSFIRPAELYGYQAGRLVSVWVKMGARSRAIVENASYNAAGGLASYSISNSSVTTITPDVMARPSQISTVRLGEPLFSTGTYSYDGLGNIATMGTDSFGYDVRSRLVSASFGGGAQTETYEYDQYGNLDKRIRNGQAWDPLIDQAHNRLSTNSGYSYDAVGNLLQDGAAVYGYDLLSRQVSYNSAAKNEAYLYDGAGERVATIESSVARRSLRDTQARLVTDFVLTGSSESSRTDYFHLGNLQVAAFAQTGLNAWTYYASDHLGTPRLEMGGIGEKGGPYPRKLFNYWPHGEARPGSESLRFGLAAMELDLGSGNHYDHARYYRGPTGRFNAPDLLSGTTGDAQSWNRYTYARNNPLKYVDPDGLSWVVFNRATNQISLYSQLLGASFGPYLASNNPQRRKKGGIERLRVGRYAFQDRRTPRRHGAAGGDTFNGMFGEFGIFRLEPYRDSFGPHDAVGIHAGRGNSTDLRGRRGYEYATNGCIRACADFMSVLVEVAAIDPLEGLDVIDDPTAASGDYSGGGSSMIGTLGDPGAAFESLAGFTLFSSSEGGLSSSVSNCAPSDTACRAREEFRRRIEH